MVLNKSKVLLLASLSIFSSAAAFADRYTVIVFDPAARQFGRSQCALSYDQAYSTAVNSLNGNPAVSTWSRNGWIALAVSSDGARYATAGVHNSQWDADQDAIARCGLDCNIAADAYSYHCY